MSERESEVDREADISGEDYAARTRRTQTLVNVRVRSWTHTAVRERTRTPICSTAFCAWMTQELMNEARFCFILSAVSKR
jgi:hypothetical protein